MAERTLSKRRPKKWLAEELRCQSIQVSITIPEDAFELSGLSRLVPAMEEADFSENEGMSGPLRLGGTGKDDFRITAAIELHKAKEPHYHLSVQGTASKEGISPKKDWPTVEAFFGAIASGISNSEDVDVSVLTLHNYPSEWWKSAMELPVSLPSVPGEPQKDGEITGLEISYEGGKERVLLSARGNAFQVIISFDFGGQISADLFRVALQRSASIGGRLFEPGTPQADND